MRCGCTVSHHYVGLFSRFSRSTLAAVMLLLKIRLASCRRLISTAVQKRAYSLQPRSAPYAGAPIPSPVSCPDRVVATGCRASLPCTEHRLLHSPTRSRLNLCSSTDVGKINLLRASESLNQFIYSMRTLHLSMQYRVLFDVTVFSRFEQTK